MIQHVYDLLFFDVACWEFWTSFIPIIDHDVLGGGHPRQSSTTGTKRRMGWDEKGVDLGSFEKPAALGGPPLLKLKEFSEPAEQGDPIKKAKSSQASVSRKEEQGWDCFLILHVCFFVGLTYAKFEITLYKATLKILVRIQIPIWR